MTEDTSPRSGLTPSQAAAFDALQAAWDDSEILFVAGRTGSTTVLRALCETHAGKLIDAADVMRLLSEGEPDRLEDTLVALCDAPRGSAVFLDDLEDILNTGGYGYADRPFFLMDLFRNVFSRLKARGVKLVAVSGPLYSFQFGGAQSLSVRVGDITAADYQHLLEKTLGRPVPAAEADVLHAKYSGLKPATLISTARSLMARSSPPYSMADFTRELERTGVLSNLQLSAAEKATVTGLVGTEGIESELYRTVLLPMLDPELAHRLGMKPKRGILLHGPPGTGKTTIGRYLAEKAGASFFLVDGSMIPGGREFVLELDAIIAEARANSPSIVFVDDADVLFANGQSVGLVRKFLSALDGIESEAQNRVCYVMTAMNIADMPPALIRSGRLEVWIETAAPDRTNRLKMIERLAAELMGDLLDADREALLDATEGFTPADIQGLVGDARSHLAYERFKGRPAQTFASYLIHSAAEIRERKAILEAGGFVTASAGTDGRDLHAVGGFREAPSSSMPGAVAGELV